MTITVYSSWFQTITSLGHSGRQKISVTDFNILSNSSCQFCTCQLKKPQKKGNAKHSSLALFNDTLCRRVGAGREQEAAEGSLHDRQHQVWKVSGETVPPDFVCVHVPFRCL